MIKVANNNKTFSHPGDQFSVSSGTLSVGTSYSTSAVYAPGAWSSVHKVDDKPVNLLNLEKLEAMLQPGEPLYVTYEQYLEIDRVSEVDHYAHNGLQTKTWKGHQLIFTNPLYEEELVARSRAMATKEAETPVSMKSTKIYETKSGSYTAALEEKNGADVTGHVYRLVSGGDIQYLSFQLGPVCEVGINGCQNEQVISALIHRLNILNSKFPCRENSLAITKLEEALMWLEKRTADREKRGVEGFNQA